MCKYKNLQKAYESLLNIKYNQPSKWMFIYMSFKCYFKMNTFIQHTFETLWQTVKDVDTNIVCTF